MFKHEVGTRLNVILIAWEHYCKTECQDYQKINWKYICDKMHKALR